MHREREKELYIYIYIYTYDAHIFMRLQKHEPWAWIGTSRHHTCEQPSTLATSSHLLTRKSPKDFAERLSLGFRVEV